MYSNIKSLEKKWLKYRVKRYLFLFLVTIIVFIVLVIGSIIYFKVFNKVIKHNNVEPTNMMEVAVQKATDIPISTVIPKIGTPTPKPIPTSTETPKPLPIPTATPTKEIVIVETPAQIENSIKLVKSEENLIETLNRRYLNEPSYTLALSLANEYFKNEQYEEALNWSIKANELDDSKEDAWILYAKSSVKLNKQADALVALKVYLNKYESQKIEALLNKINSNPQEIQKVNVKDKITLLKKSYYTAPNTKDAIELYHSYMLIENYQYAMFWVKKLIKLDSNFEDAYIYLATVSIKTGDKKEAISILEGYLKQKNSKRIERILNEIKR